MDFIRDVLGWLLDVLPGFLICCLLSGLVYGLYFLSTHDSVVTPAPSVEDRRLCAPAKFIHDCYRELGYKVEYQ
jgi:hypothetical protein